MIRDRITYSWQESKANDIARIVGTYLKCRDLFFQHNHFLILPYATKKSLFLPNLDFTTLLSLNQTSSYHSNDYSAKLFPALEKQLEKYQYPKKIDTTVIKNIFNDIRHNLEKSLEHLFPELFPNIHEVFIITTPFGTEGSFDYKKVGNSYNLYIWIRNTGMSKEEITAHLVHCLVSAFVLVATKVSDTNTVAWKQREAIIDFLLEHTELQKVWKPIQKTVSVIESKQKSQQMISDSQKYLKKLRLQINPPRVSKRGKIFSIDAIQLDRLSDKETDLLLLLYSQKNTFVNKESIYEQLYGEDEGSDWSISKLVERLRTKIEQAGIPYPILQTSRRKGYKLVSS